MIIGNVLDALGRPAEGKPDRCEICSWSCFQGTHLLICRRHAPVLAERDGVNRSTWPNVQDGDWCGDFKLRISEETS